MWPYVSGSQSALFEESFKAVAADVSNRAKALCGPVCSAREEKASCFGVRIRSKCEQTRNTAGVLGCFPTQQLSQLDIAAVVDDGGELKSKAGGRTSHRSPCEGSAKIEPTHATEEICESLHSNKGLYYRTSMSVVTLSELWTS